MEDLNKFLDNPPDNTFVYRWKSAEDFVRFEITRMHRPQKTLLVHLKDSYWAIAFIKEIDDDS